MRRPLLRSTRLAASLTAAVAFAASCSDSTGPTDGGGDSAPAALVVIEPGAVLLAGAGETMQLDAAVFDEGGAPTEATVTWQSSAPGVVSVSADGVATAGGIGSAKITASADGVVSEAVLALVAVPASGVVLIPDEQIASDPEAVDPQADYGPGWQYRIQVTGGAPETGQLVVGTGGRSLAGRVTSTAEQGSATELTIELVALNELFDDLRIHEVFPMVAGEPGAGAQGAAGGGGALRAAEEHEFELGPFTCSSESEDMPLMAEPSPTLEITPELEHEFDYDIFDGLRKFAVTGSIGAEFGYLMGFQNAYTGKVTCEVDVLTVIVPLGGVLAWFVGIHMPTGVGFELDATLELDQIGMVLTASTMATVELGLDCPTPGGACIGLTSFATEEDFEFEPVLPNVDEQARLQLGAHGYLYAKPSIGSKFSTKALFEFMAATAGLKQSVDLAGPVRQVKETDYASNVELAALLSVGPGKHITTAIEDLGELLGVELTVELGLDLIDEALAESPKGTLTITPDTVQPGGEGTPGDTATFTVELDPITYFGLESVESVQILWKKPDGDGDDFTLEAPPGDCADISAGPGQTTFTCKATFTETERGPQTFYAFVHAKMFGIPLPLPLEIAEDGSATVQVGRPTVVLDSYIMSAELSLLEESWEASTFTDPTLSFQQMESRESPSVGVTLSGAVDVSMETAGPEGVLTSASGSISAEVGVTGDYITGAAIGDAGAMHRVFFEVDQAVPFTLTGTSISLTGPSGMMTLKVLGVEVGNQDIEHGFSVFGEEPPEALSTTAILPPGRYFFDVTVATVGGCFSNFCFDDSATLDYSLVFGGEAGQVRVVEALEFGG